jgi:hypothetical protein
MAVPPDPAGSLHHMVARAHMELQHHRMARRRRMESERWTGWTGSSGCWQAG